MPVCCKAGLDGRRFAWVCLVCARGVPAYSLRMGGYVAMFSFKWMHEAWVKGGVEGRLLAVVSLG